MKNNKKKKKKKKNLKNTVPSLVVKTIEDWIINIMGEHIF